MLHFLDYIKHKFSPLQLVPLKPLYQNLKAFLLKVTDMLATPGKVTVSVTKLAKGQYLMMAY